MRAKEAKEYSHEARKREQINTALDRRFSIPYLICLTLSSVLLGGAFFEGGQAHQQESAPKQEEKIKLEKISSHVVILTVSGLRGDDVNNPAAFGHRIPTIQALRAKGAYAVSVESVYPSLTGPAHASIATGGLPSDHGIRSDYPFNEQSGEQSMEAYFLAKEIKTDTIWDAARRNGLITAAVGYPLTAGANIGYNLPGPADGEYPRDSQFGIDQLSPKEYVNPPNLLEKLSAKIGGSDPMVDKNPGQIARYQRADRLRALAAAHIIENYRPNLLVINFGSYAKAVQKFGVESEEASKALELVDELLGKIVTSIEKAQPAIEATLFLASDYGLMRVDRLFKPNVLLAKNKWLATGGNGRIISWRAVAQSFGGSAAIFVKNSQDEKLVSEVQKLFIDFHEKPDSPVWRVISRREISQLGADPQAAFYIDAAPSYGIASRAVGATTSKAPDRAANGYLPSRSEARGALIISGIGIKPGSKIEYARLIDIAPTIARLLGFEMRTARGRVLSEACVK